MKTNMQKPMYDHFQNWKPSLWQRIRLLFKKPYIACDTGYGKNKSIKLTFKVLDGSIFVIKKRTYDNTNTQTVETQVI